MPVSASQDRRLTKAMLKSLEIQGFKSFPDYTQINFHKGITAIVGPNGAGKSNITDAIRWVLGEQSAKTLRGQRMEDVIFDGTAQRRPVSFSEVTLTLDNSKRILPLDYETVSITRRYYRSGDSEYLINKTPCRLKDINRLLMDTAVGLDGYSIIGQGRVDEILSNRSEDRRAIFEEASGIVQFRSRREEALRKLERSEQNLLRVDDLLAELADQSVLLEKQAEDARSHIGLASQFRKLDTALIIRQIESLELQKAKREDEASLMESDLEDARNTQREERTVHEASMLMIDQLDRKIEEEQTRFNTLSVKETEHIGLEALYNEKYASSKQGAESMLEEKNRLIMQVMSAEQDLAGRASRREELLRRRSSFEKELAEKNNLLQSLKEVVDTYGNDLVDLTGLREAGMSKLAGIRASLREKHGERQSLEARYERLKTEKTTLSGEVDSDAGKLEILGGKRAACERRIADLEEKAAEARRKTLEGHHKADAIEQAMEDLRREIGQLAYEADTLERLELDYEGYSQPVRQIMQEEEKAGRGVLYGPLGSLLTVPDPLRQAIEVALGASAHHLVCDTQETAENWIGWLRRSQKGRATFLPVRSLTVSNVDQQSLKTAMQSPGWIGLASEMVSCDEAVMPAVRYSLGRTLLVETLEDAARLSRETRRRYSIVTRAGDVVHRGGSMTGGYRMARSTGVLGRPGRIQAARDEAEASKERLLGEEDKLEAAKEELRGRAASEEAILEDLASARRDYVRLKTEEEAGLAALQRVRDDRGKLEQEEALVTVRLAELSDLMARGQEEITEAEKEQLELEAKMGKLRSDHEEELTKYHACRDGLTKLDLSVAAITDSLDEFDAVSARTDQEIEAARLRRSSVEREWESQNQRMEQARIDIQENVKALEEVNSRIKESRALLEELMARREEEFSRQRAITGSMNSASDLVASLQSVLERRKAEIQRTEQQIDDQLNRLWETHGLTRSEAQGEAADIPSVAKATAQRAELKRNIDELGPINHNAIRDYESLKARIDFTAGQRQDIERAQAELESVVHQLDQSMREQFSETIHAVNQNFNQVFSELFSGGQAEIVLEGEADVLHADIGIRAQPPGKKLQKLSLLSGGERCLTAIALLFAILKLKPAPFCVFDEVESALDDANVKRFTDYVRRYAWSMQFILVTHRKGTMEAADRLYGVTMQERGISRVLSMVLSSALPYGD